MKDLQVLDYILDYLDVAIDNYQKQYDWWSQVEGKTADEKMKEMFYKQMSLVALRNDLKWRFKK